MTQIIQNRFFPFWLVVLSILFGTTLPTLIQDAMFQDAVLYSSVSHNLSVGFGTFWFPQYSTLNIEGIPSFHEQPPLVFGIQSLFFRLLGDSIYVERFYVLLTVILHIVLLNTLWKTIYSKQLEYKNYGWLPLLFLTIIPTIPWTYRANLMENTMSLFTLASIIISYKQILSDKMNVKMWVVSGFFIFLASFSKGIPGFFPLMFPFVYWIVTRKITFKRSINLTLILTSVPAIIYSIFLMHPVSRKSLSIYFFDRLIRRVDSMPTVDYRVELLWSLFSELLPIIVIVGVILWLARNKGVKATIARSSTDVVFFAVLGLSGSLPLMLTLVQRRCYLVPTFPLFAIAFAILVVPFIASVVQKMNMQSKGFKIFRILSIAFITGVMIVTVMQKGKISRNKEMLTDVYKIGSVVPKFSTITVPPEMYDQYNFNLQGLFVRNFIISISPYKKYEYFMKEKKENHEVPAEYKTKVNLGLVQYELYKK